MAAVKYKVGDRFNSWVLIERLKGQPRGNRKWKFRCDCGAVKEVLAANVTSGKSKNCHPCGIKKRDQKYWDSVS